MTDPVDRLLVIRPLRDPVLGRVRYELVIWYGQPPAVEVLLVADYPANLVSYLQSQGFLVVRRSEEEDTL